MALKNGKWEMTFFLSVCVYSFLLPLTNTSFSQQSDEIRSVLLGMHWGVTLQTTNKLSHSDSFLQTVYTLTFACSHAKYYRVQLMCTHYTVTARNEHHCNVRAG